jgi:predicted TIM-barrel fold metal-dependent hydrolase
MMPNGNAIVIDADAHVVECEWTWDFMDASIDVDAIKIFKERMDISAEAKRKILSDNAKALYGL